VVLRGKQFFRIGLILLSSLILIVVSGFAADQDMFDLYNLEVEGDIYDFVTGDFDGDELTDIVIVYSPIDDIDSRYAGLYLQKGSDGFRPRADYLVPLPPSAVQIDSADIDGDGINEVLLIDGGGVSYLKYSDGSGLSRPIRLIKENTVFAIPSFTGIVVEPIAREIISTNNAPEILVPINKGYAIYEKTDDGNYQKLNQLNVNIFCHNDRQGIRSFAGKRSPQVTIELPRIYNIDGNGDGRPDLYFLWNQKVCTFFQDNTGNYPQDPDVETRFFNGIQNGYMQSQLADCNGDGRPDIVVSLTSGGVTNTETTIRYYLADNNGRINRTDLRDVNLSDSHCNLLVTDFNRDNIPEIVVPAVEMGAIAASKMFLLKKSDLYLLIYPIKNGLPATEPAKRIEYEFRFDFEHPNPTEEISINWSANYNYDVLLDAVFSDGNGRLLFFWGNDKDYLSRRPDLEITLDHPSAVYPVHLNKGTLSDLIVEHNLSGRFDRLTVLKNRNNKI